MEDLALVLEKMEWVSISVNMNATRFSMSEPSLIERLQEFLETEARSCSMDFGCITPLYVYRMWGGQYPIEEIENGLAELQMTQKAGNEH